MSIHTASFGSLEDQSTVVPASHERTSPRPFFALVLQWANAHRFFLLGCVVLFYVAAFTGRWQAESDSALYLSLGRSLAHGHGYTDQGQANHLVYPGLPWLIAATFKIFGVDHLMPIHVVMLGFACLTLVMVYAMLVLRVDRPTAVVVTALLALSDTFFRYSMKVLTDMPFMAGAMAVLLGCELIGWHDHRARGDALPKPTTSWAGWALIGAGLALATIMRPVIWALLFTLLATAIVSAIGRKWQWKYIAIAGVACLMIGAFLFFDPRRAGGNGLFGTYEASALNSLRDGEMFHRMLHQNLTPLLGSVTAEAILGMRIGPLLNQIAAGLTIIVGVGLWRRQPIWALWVVITLLMMLAMLPVRRYYLPILPFLLLGSWLGIVWLNRNIPHRVIANIICASLFIILAGSNIVRCANFSLQQHDIFIIAKGDRLSEDVMTKDFSWKLKHRLPADSVILAPRRFARVLGYMSTRHTIAVGSGVQLSELHSPAFVVLPLNGTDVLANADLIRLGLKPGRRMFLENAVNEYQYCVYAIDLPK